MKLIITGGTHINDAARCAVEKSNALHAQVSFDFNDITVVVDPGSNIENIVAGYQQEAAVIVTRHHT